jgi:asparagine synthase (glutamine-hydrolysing)
MCGIVGFLNVGGRPASLAVLKSMTEALGHRGPDGEGTFVDGPLALGHRRLAILDLTDAARQPMATPDGRFLLTYNGEVYNFLALREELEAKGRVFRSRSDSEVVLAALAEWGPDACSRFNGMFALAIWDRLGQQLTLIRDRYGIKPLYVAELDGCVAFASEIKALRRHPSFASALDLEALVEYFTFQNLFTNRTLFNGVRLLPPGTTLSLSTSGSHKLRTSQYWRYTFAEPSAPRSEADYLDELAHLFQRAVKRQLVSDVDVGAYLSGGTDSGSITAIAARERPSVKSFTCGFDLTTASGLELGFDERQAAKRLSYTFKTEHYEIVLKSGDMERVMPRLVYHLEEPRVGQCYPNFYAAQLAGRFVKVVLSGVGGDELFGGYPWRYYRALINDDFDQYIDKYYDFWQRLIPSSAAANVFAPIRDHVKHVQTRDIFRDVFADHRSRRRLRPEDYVNLSMLFEARTFLHGLLVVEDKMSMANSLETRVPFLDNDLVDFASTLPAHLKLANLTEAIRLNENEAGAKRVKYFQRTRDGKLLLRRMMSRYLPAEIAEREKQGFSAPDSSWFKGESIDYVRHTLYAGKPRLYRLLDQRAVQALVDDHLEGRENRRLLIWSLLYVEDFLRQYFPDL